MTLRAFGLDSFRLHWSPSYSGVEQMVARVVHNLEVAGSSPAPAST